MADPITEPGERLTPISYGLDDHELDVVIALMAGHHSGLPSVAAVIDLALWKLAVWYDIPMDAKAFDLGRRARRDKQVLHEHASPEAGQE